MVSDKKKCQIDVDKMAWQRLKAMKPVKFKSMAKWSAHILEQHSLNIDEAAQVKLMNMNNGQMGEVIARLAVVEKKLGVAQVPEETEDVQVDDSLPEISLVDVDLDTLPLADLKVLGAAHLPKEYKTKKSLLQHLHIAQDELLEDDEEEDETEDESPIWERGIDMHMWTRNDLRAYAEHLEISSSGSKDTLKKRIRSELSSREAAQKQPKKTTKKAGKKKRSGFVMPDLS